ncbi:MAG: hypothetical protein GX443_06610 [Deltaproteobacteria bacterium]|nr:hypothetical protein [Deltaproteobacteria bacterium]
MGWEPLNFENMQLTSLQDRPSKVRLADFGRPWEAGQPFRSFVASLPNILGAQQFRAAVVAMAEACRGGRSVLLGMGAHPIKVGLNPIIIDAMERRMLTGIALNGAGIIHDVEVALAGKTSEDVAAHLESGQFGTARETGDLIHGAVRGAMGETGKGLGQVVGEYLLRLNPPHARLSLLATAARLGIPMTVHVAFGTDIIHMHPSMDGGAMGALTHHDFRLFARLVSTLENGVFINLGSAVIIPEVFLKAYSAVRNMGGSLSGITTVNMDFQNQYRPRVNVVERPTAATGQGITLIGHHEIMFPLLLACVIESLSEES